MASRSVLFDNPRGTAPRSPAGRSSFMPNRGSAIRSSSFATSPLVRDRGGRVILIVQPSLRRVLHGTEGVDLLLCQGDPIPAFDVHAPLLSLPRLFGTDIETIPARVPYLFPEHGRFERWRRELSQVAGFKVGIAWQGNPKYRRDRDRSVPLEQFAGLASLPGVTLVGLQVGHGRDQIAAHRDLVPMLDLGERLDGDGPFLDTIAVMNCLDLIVTADTVLAHLAGALGVPTWIALGRVPHWTWLLDRADSPWYPSARLFPADAQGRLDRGFPGDFRVLPRPAAPTDPRRDRPRRIVRQARHPSNQVRADHRSRQAPQRPPTSNSRFSNPRETWPSASRPTSRPCSTIFMR